MRAGVIDNKAWQVFRGNDDQYRFVNHEERLASTGFGSEVGLLKNADIIRIDAKTIILMRERYLKLFPKGKVGVRMTTTEKGAKFTAGPWHVERIVYVYAGTQPICSPVGGEYRSDEEAGADARLIAAAPEMLEALRHAHIYLVQSNNSEQRELADELWAVILKAEGRD